MTQDDMATAEADLQRFSQQGMRVRLPDLSPHEGWILMSALKFARTHATPESGAAQVTGGLALLLERELAMTPALKAVASLGWPLYGDGEEAS